MIVDVIYKIDRGSDTVVAFFPGLSATNRHDLICYAHIGQHASASLDYVRACRPASPDQYAALHAELTQIGYQLRVVRRMTAAHATQRMEACKR